jgi:type IV pilus assembly protein PilC
LLQVQRGEFLSTYRHDCGVARRQPCPQSPKWLLVRNLMTNSNATGSCRPFATGWTISTLSERAIARAVTYDLVYARASEVARHPTLASCLVSQGFPGKGRWKLPFEEWVVAHARISKKPHRGAKLEDTLSFFHQLSTLVGSGTPLLQSLKIAAAQCESTKLRAVLDAITAKVAAGSTFHAGAASFPHVFEFQWLEAIRTGEVTGKMSQVLTELNKQIRESRETKRKVKGALMYPLILIVVAVIAVTVMLWLVVPVFAKMFKDMDAQLPGITQFVVDASDAIVKYGPYGVIAIVAAVVGFKQFLKTDNGRKYVFGLLMVVPTVGQLVIEMAMYRFASNLSLLLKSGVPMMETMYTIKGIFQSSPIYRDALERVAMKVASGKPLHAALIESGLFLPMLTSMVQVGEESGQLAVVMEQVAPFFKEKMEGMSLKVTKMVEPIIIMGMGSSIAGLMLAIYMPMFEMAGNVK